MMPGYIAGAVIFLLAIWLALGNLFYNKAIRIGPKDFLNSKPKEPEEPLLPIIPSPAIADYNKAVNDWAAAPAEVWHIEVEDGLRLSADYYPVEQSHRWAVVVHGYTSRGRHMGEFSYEYSKRGFQVLAPDCRGHGDSDGFYIGMGWHDRLDVIKWIGEILKKDPDAEILMTGVSMGAATVMMASGEVLPPQVRCVVEDCGYTSVDEQLAHSLKKFFHLPRFPLLAASSLICRWRAGYGFKTASALKQVQKSRLPILFIHGGDDDFVPTKMVYKLYEAATGDKELLIIEGAAHACAVTTDPVTYWAKVDGFLKRYIAY